MRGVRRRGDGNRIEVLEADWVYYNDGKEMMAHE